jgi:hypothetical protein
LFFQQLQQSKPIVATSIAGQPVQPVRYSQEVQPTAQPEMTQTAGPGVVRLASGGSIPHLTEDQKKIVAEFKQKMAQLPPEQHTQFIAAHKANLIKQLNFQPTQLQLLRSNQVLFLL